MFSIGLRLLAALAAKYASRDFGLSGHPALTDVIGSVRQKTDAFGTAVHEDVRAPYGSTLLGRSYQNGPAFTGHMEDGATGLTYMKARYYDPVAMRFISPDPVYVDLGTGGNFNRYWYANNNPYTYTDPDGRYARGPGFSDHRWARFSNAQNQAYQKVERALKDLTNAIAGGNGAEGAIQKFENVFGSGSATPENMQAIAGTLRGMLTALDDGREGPPVALANLDTYANLSQKFPGFGQATPAAVVNGRDVYINQSHPEASTASMGGNVFRWTLAHEAAHTAGLRGHGAVGGHLAYRYGSPQESSAYKKLSSADPSAALRNADHVVKFVW